MTQSILLRPECVAAGGDVVVGVLLSQMVYWSTRMKVRDYTGVFWVAKTREDWMAETGLTLDQYKRAIQVLKRKNLVEVKVMRFKGVAMSHTRLLQPIALRVGKPPAAWVDTHHPGGGSCTNPVRTETTTETTTERSGVNARAEIQSDVTGQKVDEPEDIGKYPGRQNEQNLIHNGTWKASMKAAEILKQFHAPSTGNLSSFWQSRCAVIFGGYQKAHTAKEKAQLKQLQVQLGDQAKPVIDYVLNHWNAFTTRAGIAAGCSYPADPHIGFLLKHHAVAVNLLQPAPVAPSVVVEPLVQSVATGTESVPTHQVSSQELTDLLEGLNSP